MENDLQSIYENNYLKSKVILEKADNDDEDEGEDTNNVGKTGKKKFNKPMKKKKTPYDAGAGYNEAATFDNAFDKLIREMDEDFGASDDTFDYDSANGADADAGEDQFGSDENEQSFTLSELKNMTLQELSDLVSGSGVADNAGDEFGDDEFSYGDGDDDEIPAESYSQMGGGKNVGSQGNYDGKAKRQGPSTLVKGNGDGEFGKQKTGFDPDDTEGSEGAEHGAQGTYDGKAKRQGPSNLVKGNGDGEFGKQKTGYKTGSGKKDKNLF